MIREDQPARRLRRVRLALVAALAGVAAPAVASALDADFDFEDGFRVRGDGWRADAGSRLHVDSAVFSGTGARGAQDGTMLRRARLRGSAELGRWSVRADYEFGEVGPGWKNAWAQYEFSGRSAIRVGSQVAPFGLEDTMSSDDLPFLERSAAGVLGPGLLTGAALRASNARWSFAAGVFGDNLSDDDRRSLPGRSVVARLVHVPYRAESVVVHVGVSGEFRDGAAGAQFRLRPPGPTRVGDLVLLDTGRLAGVDTLANTAVEAALRAGPVTLQGEYVKSRLARAAATDVAFTGWYVAGTWAITGEQRRYSRAGGTFSELDRPRRPAGAFELALRYGTLDLVDADVDGGEERSLSVGLNWYMNRNLRVMLSHVTTDAERRSVDLDAPDVTMVRLQYSF